MCTRLFLWRADICCLSLRVLRPSTERCLRFPFRPGPSFSHQLVDGRHTVFPFLLQSFPLLYKIAVKDHRQHSIFKLKGLNCVLTPTKGSCVNVQMNRRLVYHRRLIIVNLFYVYNISSISATDLYKAETSPWASSATDISAVMPSSSSSISSAIELKDSIYSVFTP